MPETCPRPSIERRPGVFVHMDRVMAESSPAQAEYETLLGDLEDIAVRVLAEQNIPINGVSMQSLDDGLKDYSERGTIAMHAYVSIRLLKGWAADAVGRDEASADAFHRVAYHAAMAAMTAALVGPMVTELKTAELYVYLAQLKGNAASTLSAKARAKSISSALADLWASGVRNKGLDAWSNAVSALNSKLAPPKGKTNTAMNRIVSREGKLLFGADWRK